MTRAEREDSPSKHAIPWSIGMLGGDEPTRLASLPGVPNPVLSRHQVDDVPAAFVADPFMTHHRGSWWMFFEVMNKNRQKGEIGLARSADGRAWSYLGIVLAEPFHLSYPYVFAWKGEHYMLPETLDRRGVSLYRATDFPHRWRLEATLIEGRLADPSILRFADHWWLFACPQPPDSEPGHHDELRLFHAPRLREGWREHPRSPIVSGNPATARPGGRVLDGPHRPIRFAQVCTPAYGMKVRAFEILTLTPEAYEERELAESPVLEGSGSGWNGFAMHHVDAHRLPSGKWIACVDGRARGPDPPASAAGS